MVILIFHLSSEIETSNHKTTHLYVSFFYNLFGETMYIETVIVFNIYIDYIVILLTSILIKQKIPINKQILVSTIGGLSSLLLFLNISIIELIITTILISLIIVKMAFNSLKAIIYFYLNSILIGGIIFLMNNYLDLNTVENYITLVIITPIIVILYKRKTKNLKENYNLKYQVKFKYQGQNITLNSFLDTGNNLKDPYFNKPVILINDYLIKTDKFFYIPYSTITESGVIKAIYMKEIEIVGIKRIKNIVIGLLPQELKLNSVECLLNNKLMEELNA